MIGNLVFVCSVVLCQVFYFLYLSYLNKLIIISNKLIIMSNNGCLVCRNCSGDPKAFLVSGWCVYSWRAWHVSFSCLFVPVIIIYNFLIFSISLIFIHFSRFDIIKKSCANKNSGLLVWTTIFFAQLFFMMLKWRKWIKSMR